MKILFYNTWPNKEEWLKAIKKKFKKSKILTLQDSFNFEDVEIAIIWNLPNEILAKLKNLKVIFSLGAGVDHILKLPNYKKTPIVRIKHKDMAKRMSNHVLSQILIYQLNLNYYNEGQKKNSWLKELDTNHNNQIIIGILGIGYLGNAVGKFLKKLNYHVIGYKNFKNKKNSLFPIYQLDNFIKKSDIIVSLLPSTNKTINFINLNFLKKMKKNSLLINVGRGEVLNESDLLKHLKNNKNFYVSLDVLKKEPLSKKSKLWQNSNITITPHIAAITDVESSVEYIHNRFLKYLKTKKVKSDVNLKIGY